ncbi:MAG: hypothetical protein P8X85_14330 [Desulfobacterales bacterium]
MEQDKIGDAGAAHGNKGRNARTGCNKNGRSLGTFKNKITVGTCQVKVRSDVGIGKDRRKTALGNIINYNERVGSSGEESKE